MNNQDYQYDKAGRLTAEDQLMMSNSNATLKRIPSSSEEQENVGQTSPQLSSTPTKCTFEENMKKIEMPKPFQL